MVTVVCAVDVIRNTQLVISTYIISRAALYKHEPERRSLEVVLVFP